jgi:D-3-phosphoglycerate dehydrogenase
MSDYLIDGAVANALNKPSITAEEAPRLTPFVTLADQLGSFAGQLTETGVRQIRIEYEGNAAAMNTRALTAAVLTGFLKPLLQSVNMVSAPVMARERGIQVEEVRREHQGAYEGYIRVTVETERRERSVAGTVFSGGRPRIIQVKNINMEAELLPEMLYVTNLDRPGFIGRLGTALGAEGVNIATFNLGRSAAGEDAIALIGVDQEITEGVLEKVRTVDGVLQAKRLRF